MDVTVAADASSINVLSKGAVQSWNTIRRLANMASRPDVLEGSFFRPHEDAFRLAVLAWSFAEWSTFSGYAYSATGGAHYVRKILLDGSVSIPESAVVFFDNPLKNGVRDPRPVFVVRAESTPRSINDVDEFLGLGVSWGGRFVAILPCAGDADGEIYRRLTSLMESGGSVRYVRVVPVLEAAGFKRLDQVLTVTDSRTNRTLDVTSAMPMDQRNALVEDRHPFRLDPTALPRRVFPPGRTQRFYLVEDAAERGPLPKVRQRKTRRTVVDRMARLDRLTAVRGSDRDLWHIASHVRFVAGRPRDAIVFCGRDTALSLLQARPMNGTGLDGGMPVCGACTKVMGMKSARERRRLAGMQVPDQTNFNQSATSIDPAANA